jgi:hypothetical protein
MKYVKMLGLLAVAAVALTSFAGSASATITSPAGTAYTGNLQMTATNMTFHTGQTVSCGHSVIEGSVSKGETTVSLNVLTFTKCGTDTFAVLKKGHMSIASNGTVFLTGTEYTELTHRTILGFPVTTHCILNLNNTVVGTLTEGVSPAELHAGSAEIPDETPTDGGCGNAILTGEYTVTNPSGAITID